MGYKIKTVSVSSSSRRYTSKPSGSEDNFNSFLLEKEQNEYFTREEAMRAKFEMSFALKKALLLDELAQGLVDKKFYLEQLKQLERRYGTIFKSLDKDPNLLFRLPDIETER